MYRMNTSDKINRRILQLINSLAMGGDTAYTCEDIGLTPEVLDKLIIGKYVYHDLLGRILKSRNFSKYHKVVALKRWLEGASYKDRDNYAKSYFERCSFKSLDTTLSVFMDRKVPIIGEYKIHEKDFKDLSQTVRERLGKYNKVDVEIMARLKIGKTEYEKVFREVIKLIALIRSEQNMGDTEKAKRLERKMLKKYSKIAKADIGEDGTLSDLRIEYMKDGRLASDTPADIESAKEVKEVCRRFREYVGRGQISRDTSNKMLKYGMSADSLINYWDYLNLSMTDLLKSEEIKMHKKKRILRGLNSRTRNIDRLKLVEETIDIEDKKLFRLIVGFRSHEINELGESELAKKVAKRVPYIAILNKDENERFGGEIIEYYGEDKNEIGLVRRDLEYMMEEIAKKN